jgi:uncharacterized protein
MPLAKELLELLACPACGGVLNEAGESLICPACQLEYPVRQGIAVLQINQSRTVGAH